MSLSWPTPDDVIAKLPFDSFEPEEMERKHVSESDVERYIADWRHRLSQGSHVEPAPTESGVSVVLRGARADALEQYYIVQGLEIPRSVESLRREAYRMLTIYENEVNLPGESTDDPSLPDEEDGVVNFMDKPLWDSHGDHDAVYAERGRWPYA